MFKVVVFDLDGTLIDSINIWLSLFEKVFKKYGLDVNENCIKNQFGKQDKEIISFFAKKEKREEMIDFFEVKKKDKTFLNKFKTFPFTAKVLTEIKSKGIKISVATGNNNKIMNFILKKYDLNKFLDYHICAEEVKKGKPNPEMLLKVLKFFKVKKKDLIYIGDSPHDVKMARNAGVKIGVVLTGVLDRKSAEKLKPDFIFEDVRGVLELV